MKKVLAAAAATFALSAPSVWAADSLVGMYGGINLGAANASMTTEDSDCWYECSAYTNRGNGLDYGLKLGQNLVSGSLLYGWDVDYSLANGVKNDYKYADYSNLNGLAMDVNGELKSLLAVKAKAGILVQDTALTLSFGWAQGDFNEEFRDQNGTASQADDQVAKSANKVEGLVYAAGLQHAIGNNLIVSADVQKYAFHTDTELMHDANGSVNTSYYHIRFVNDVNEFRVGVTYKFW